MKISTILILSAISLNVGLWANALHKYDLVKKPVDIDAPATGDELHALVVTVCVKGECDKYAIDKNFTLADCKQEAKARHLDDTPVVKWECIILDVE